MKICSSCNGQNDDSANVCEYCGSSDFKSSAPATQETQAPQAYASPYEYQQPVVAKEPEPDLGNGNVIAGIVGAFLFSIIGGLLYFLLYQVNVIAGISGLVIFVLASFGYNLFAKGNKNTITGLVVCIIILLLMIFIAEYLCLSFEIYKILYKDAGLSFFDAVQDTPEYLEDAEIRSAVIEDLAFAVIFGIAASLGNIINIVKSRKKN